MQCKRFNWVKAVVKSITPSLAPPLTASNYRPSPSAHGWPPCHRHRHRNRNYHHNCYQHNFISSGCPVVLAVAAAWGLRQWATVDCRKLMKLKWFHFNWALFTIYIYTYINTYISVVVCFCFVALLFGCILCSHSVLLLVIEASANWKCWKVGCLAWVQKLGFIDWGLIDIIFDFIKTPRCKKHAENIASF